MLVYRGYGVFIVLLDYFMGIYLGTKFLPSFLPTEKQQYIALIVYQVVITLINFCLAKFLNREEVKHTVYGGKLETVVLIGGAAGMLLILLMAKEVFMS